MKTHTHRPLPPTRNRTEIPPSPNPFRSRSDYSQPDDRSWSCLRLVGNAVETRDLFFFEDGVQLRIGKRRSRSAIGLPRHGEWMGTARNRVLCRLLRSTQASLNVCDEQFLKRDALLDSTGLCFLKNRVGQVEGHSHGTMSGGNATGPRNSSITSFVVRPAHGSFQPSTNASHTSGGMVIERSEVRVTCTGKVVSLKSQHLKSDRMGQSNLTLCPPRK